MNKEPSTAARLEAAFDAQQVKDARKVDAPASETLITELRNAAKEIAAAGHSGWGNTCTDAADELTRLKGEAGVLRALLALSRRSLVEIVADDSDEQEMLDALIDKIDALFRPVPSVQFVPADDTEGGAA